MAFLNIVLLASLTLVIRAVISFTTKHDKNEAFEFFFISNVCDPES
ncbi:unnamed protein product, partial [Brassica rapa subsp. narinosa]